MREQLSEKKTEKETAKKMRIFSLFCNKNSSKISLICMVIVSQIFQCNSWVPYLNINPKYFMVTRILDLVLSSGSNNLIIPQAHQKGNIALFVKFNLTIPSSAGRNPRWLKDNPQSVLPAGFQGIFQSTPILLRNRFDPPCPPKKI